MDESLRFLADYYRKREEQRRMITGAVSYRDYPLDGNVGTGIYDFGHCPYVRTGVCSYGRRTSGYNPVDYFVIRQFSGLFIDFFGYPDYGGTLFLFSG